MASTAEIRLKTTGASAAAAQTRQVSDTLRKLDKDQEKVAGSGAKAQKRTMSFGRALKFAGAAAAGIGGFRALIGGLTGMIRSAGEAERAIAQTKAVIKSTGGVAGISNDHVTGLVGTIQDYSGTSDEVVRGGANMLLTFKNIRNQGDGVNAIFDRATRAVVDMSHTFDQDVKASSVQLGKALGDPIKGVTALQRVGVSFTAAEKEKIKTLVESGKTAQAQKMILRGLEAQTKGSAAAFGKTSAGQIAIFKQNLGDLGEQIGAKMLPPLVRLSKMGTNLAKEWKAGTGNGKRLRQVVMGIGTAFTIAGKAVKSVVEWFVQHKDVTLALTAAVAALVSAMLAYKATVAISKGVMLLVKATQLLTTATGRQTIARWALNVAEKASTIGLIVAGVALLVAAFVYLNQKYGIVTKATEWFMGALRTAWEWIRDNWKLLASILGGPIVAAILHFDKIKAAVSAMWQKVKDTFGAMRDWFLGLPGKFAEWAKGIGTAIIDGIVDGIRAAPGKVADALSAILPGGLSLDAATSWIPGQATGGLSTGGATLVGERGPEIVRLPAGAQVRPASQVSPVMQRGEMGGTHVSKVYLDGRQIAEAVGQVVSNRRARG